MAENDRKGKDLVDSKGRGEKTPLWANALFPYRITAVNRTNHTVQMIYGVKVRGEETPYGGIQYVIPPMSFIRFEVEFVGTSTLMVVFYDDVNDPSELTVADLKGVEGLTEAPLVEVEKGTAFRDEDPVVLTFAVGVN